MHPSESAGLGTAPCGLAVRYSHNPRCSVLRARRTQPCLTRILVRSGRPVTAQSLERGGGGLLLRCLSRVEPGRKPAALGFRCLRPVESSRQPAALGCRCRDSDGAVAARTRTARARATSRGRSVSPNAMQGCELGVKSQDDGCCFVSYDTQGQRKDWAWSMSRKDACTACIALFSRLTRSQDTRLWRRIAADRERKRKGVTQGRRSKSERDQIREGKVTEQDTERNMDRTLISYDGHATFEQV
jgi:hypothetical protein